MLEDGGSGGAIVEEFGDNAARGFEIDEVVVAQRLALEFFGSAPAGGGVADLIPARGLVGVFAVAQGLDLVSGDAVVFGERDGFGFGVSALVVEVRGDRAIVGAGVPKSGLRAGAAELL